MFTYHLCSTFNALEGRVPDSRADSRSYLDLGAGGGRSPFFVGVEVFREQAADEVTAQKESLRESVVQGRFSVQMRLYLLFAALH